MNKDIMRKAGFGQHVKDVEGGVCPFCKIKVDTNAFKDELSRREYKISGLCQSCQDDIFGIE